MFNEILFFIHIFVVVIFTFLASRQGKELLISWIVLQSVLANLFVLKQIHLFHLNVTCSDVYAVGAFLTLNLIQELYSSASAKTAIRTAALLQAIFLVMSQFQLQYVPSAEDVSQKAFEFLLTPYPRIVAASLAVFYCVQMLDVKIFSKIKSLFPWLPFAYRNTLCLMISQTLDTVLFTFLGLYGIIASVGDVVLLSLAIKMILIGTTTLLTLFIKQRVTA